MSWVHARNSDAPSTASAHCNSASPSSLAVQWCFLFFFILWLLFGVFLGGVLLPQPWRGARNQSAHRNKGSRWYFRQTYRLDTYNTYHLMSGSCKELSERMLGTPHACLVLPFVA